MSSSRKLRLDLSRYYRLPSVQVSLGVVLALFIVATLLIFAIRPTLETIVKLQKEIGESRETLNQLETKVASLERAAKLLEAIKPHLPTVEKSVPGEGVGYDELARNLAALATDTGTTIETFSIGPAIVSSRLVNAYLPSKNQTVQESSVSIRLKGSYAAVANFFRRVAGTLRLTSIESVMIVRDGSGKTGSSSGNVSMTVTGAVHYVADPGAVSKAIKTEGGK